MEVGRWRRVESDRVQDEDQGQAWNSAEEAGLSRYGAIYEVQGPGARIIMYL